MLASMGQENPSREDQQHCGIFPQHCNLLTLSSKDLAVKAALDLAKALKNPVLAAPACTFVPRSTVRTPSDCAAEEPAP